MNFATPGAIALINGGVIPATLYVQLHLGDPGTNGTANLGSLPTRQSFTRTTAAGTPTTDNTNLVQWIAAPNTEDLYYLSLWSASSGGTCWFVGPITGAPAAAVAGQNVEIQIGSLDLSLDVWA